MHYVVTLLALIPTLFHTVVCASVNPRHGHLAEALAARLSNDSTPCTDLRHQLKLDNTTIISATNVLAGTNVSLGANNCQPSVVINSTVCRVEFYYATTNISGTRGEIWIPEGYNGRLMTVGNLAVGGCLDYVDMNYMVSLNFATVNCDAGHDADVAADFLNKPETIIDFSYRALHFATVTGKSILEQYTKVSGQKSYYFGCSLGGKQGGQAALFYPEDYNGIVAGSPAFDFNNLQGWAGMLSKYVGSPVNADSPAENFISSDLWTVISDEILNQCDMLDGLKDGIITEPDECDFRPETILCPENAQNTSACLTNAQLQAVEQIYSPLYGTSGELLFPRYDPGAEGQGLAELIFNGQFFPLTEGWYTNTIYNDSNHDYTNFSRSDIEFAATINPGSIATFSGDFSAFEAAGGKFLTFHGRHDELIASGNSKRMYDLIATTLDRENIDNFYRLFLIPGMDHCIQGLGSYDFGQFSSRSNVINDTQHNVVWALVDWVENDHPPPVIIGTNPITKVQRDHCHYPAFKSIWNGTNWNCDPTG